MTIQIDREYVKKLIENTNSGVTFYLGYDPESNSPEGWDWDWHTNGLPPQEYLPKNIHWAKIKVEADANPQNLTNALFRQLESSMAT